MKTWLDVPGYFTEFDWLDYEHLVNNLPDNSYLVEVGNYRGRSLASISETIKRKNIKVLAIDIFDKVKSDEYVEEDVEKTKVGMHDDFINTMNEFGLQNNVTVFVGTSLEGANYCKKNGIIPTMVFLDDDHSYEYVSKEIDAWWPLVKIGGVLSGHDYDHNGLRWPGVYKAVQEKFGQPYFGVFIWAVKKTKTGFETKSLIQ